MYSTIHFEHKTVTTAFQNVLKKFFFQVNRLLKKHIPVHFHIS
jgi:hypothetical protein